MIKYIRSEGMLDTTALEATEDYSLFRSELEFWRIGSPHSHIVKPVDISHSIAVGGFTPVIYRPVSPSPGLRFDSDWTDIELKFAVYDKDGSGYLDAGELMQLMADLGHAGNSDRSQRLINKCASAPGGKLSFVDFWLAHTGSSLAPTYNGRYKFLLVRTF